MRIRVATVSRFALIFSTTSGKSRVGALLLPRRDFYSSPVGSKSFSTSCSFASIFKSCFRRSGHCSKESCRFVRARQETTLFEMSSSSTRLLSSNNNVHKAFTACSTCRGEGRITLPPTRKQRLRFKRAKMNDSSTLDDNLQPPPRKQPCTVCQGTGLVVAQEQKKTTKLSPQQPTLHVAIIGGGIGGLALGIALKHRNISFTIYEKDKCFDERRQGYGLTLQQASKALKFFGMTLRDGIKSKRHVVFTSTGTMVGEWGMRKWCGKGDSTKNNDGVSKNQGGESKGSTGTCSSSSNHRNNDKLSNKRQNVHIARQALRYQLLEALGGSNEVEWNCQLKSIEYEGSNGRSHCEDQIKLTFTREVDNSSNAHDSAEPQSSSSADPHSPSSSSICQVKAGIVVGADGIRSSVRDILIGEETTPLRYLGCIVILGICRTDSIHNNGNLTSSSSAPSSLLDGETVFQTADGTTRLYSMPYSNTEYMWQLSFPMEEDAAIELSRTGNAALKEEAFNRCKSWHDPIPQLLEATPCNLISGYPTYDRTILGKETLSSPPPQAIYPQDSKRWTLIGDAAHPMSPFKGQGANQAMLDALSLARNLYNFTTLSSQKEESSVTTPSSLSAVATPTATATTENTILDLNKAITSYEEEMLRRSSAKVKASAEAAHFLHTDIAIQKGNVTRGGLLKKQQECFSEEKKNP